MPGMRPVGSGQSFTWTVAPWQAEFFAEMVGDLAEPARKSGSAVLECGSIGEIQVKVSLGEFTDDFLASAGSCGADRKVADEGSLIVPSRGLMAAQRT
jgi:hypothetical protein